MDWIKFGWGAYMHPEFNEKDNLIWDISAAPKNINTPPIDIAISTIRQISSTYPAPYNLMVSGGVDSQAMLYAWHKSGIPFTAINVRYISNDQYFNEEDTKCLLAFAKIHKIPITFIDFDIIDFLENRLDNYTYKYQCTSPQICTHMAFSEMVTTGTVVFSGNYIFDRNVPGNYTVMGIKRYADISKRPIIPFFFMHTGELAVSFDIFIDRDRQNRKSGMSGYHRKCNKYHMGGFPVIPQSRKMTGFEYVKDYYDRFSLNINTKDKLRYANEHSKRAFDFMFRYKYKNAIKYNDQLLVRILP